MNNKNLVMMESKRIIPFEEMTDNEKRVLKRKIFSFYEMY